MNIDEFSKEKNQFIQVCCDFYNEHSESDKQWFAHNYDQCDEPHEKRNLCMHKWQFPLFALRSQQAELEAKDKQIAELESKLYDLHASSVMAAVNQKTKAEYLELKQRLAEMLEEFKCPTATNAELVRCSIIELGDA